MTAITGDHFGQQLKGWRQLRHFSQLDLSSIAEVSQRHLSFLETGRAEPSREMVIHLATVLEVPLRNRNEWLASAGFASIYTERSLGEPAMEQVRRVIDQILDLYQPFPAYVVDRRWDIVLTNQSASSLTAALVGPEKAPLFRGNVLRLSLHPDGLRRYLVNWTEAATSLLHRLHREVAERPTDEDLSNLLDDIMEYPGVAELPTHGSLPTGEDLLVPLHIRTPDLELRLFTTIATIGAPHDITLEELRIETLLPADEGSEEALRGLGGD